MTGANLVGGHSRSSVGDIAIRKTDEPRAANDHAQERGAIFSAFILASGGSQGDARRIIPSREAHDSRERDLEREIDLPGVVAGASAGEDAPMPDRAMAWRSLRHGMSTDPACDGAAARADTERSVRSANRDWLRPMLWRRADHEGQPVLPSIGSAGEVPRPACALMRPATLPPGGAVMPVSSEAPAHRVAIASREAAAVAGAERDGLAEPSAPASRGWQSLEVGTCPLATESLGGPAGQSVLSWPVEQGLRGPEMIGSSSGKPNFSVIGREIHHAPAAAGLPMLSPVVRQIAAGLAGQPQIAAASAPFSSAMALRGVAGANKVITIALAPADLGTVEVRLSLREDVLELRMSVSSPSTAHLLAQDRDALTAILRRAGYLVDGVSIQIAESPRASGAGNTPTGHAAAAQLADAGAGQTSGERSMADGHPREPRDDEDVSRARHAVSVPPEESRPLTGLYV